jgi:hypothetical protein
VSDSRDSYYGRPVVKPPVWTWEIPVYIFTGGLAGASAGLAYGAGLTDRDVLARRAWLVALAGVGISPVLLISDLGRPERFYNMLRVFKITSPMNMGSWLLSAAGGAIALATAHEWLGLFGSAGRTAKPAAAILGAPLATYTAALVANSANPAWHEARHELPFVFAGSSAASAGGAAVILAPAREAAPARRLAIAGAGLSLAATKVMEHRLGDLARPYEEGFSGKLTKAAKALTATGGAAMALGARDRRAARAGGALLIAGALTERWAVFKAGFASAKDPSYIVNSQRRRTGPSDTPR